MKQGRPEGLHGGTREFTAEMLQWIAEQFNVGPEIEVEEFSERGNINLHTYQVTNSRGEQFLLQRINEEVFRDPHRVMAAMTGWCECQSQTVSSIDHEWVPLSLVTTLEGNTFLDLGDSATPSVWRMLVKIPNTKTFKSLGSLGSREEQIQLAYQTGLGLAINARLVRPLNPNEITSSLPGYRDTKGYYQQFHSILRGNRSPQEAIDLLPSSPEIRHATESQYWIKLDSAEYHRRCQDPMVKNLVEIAQQHESFALKIQEMVSQGDLQRTAIHGDTKIENFLYCRDTGEVRSLIDLDTIMPYTWLADWGDLARSLVNPAGEKERDLDRVQVDFSIYEALRHGFLSATDSDESETKWMEHATATITLELGVRFLADYLRGDDYFALRPEDDADLNLVRASVQLKLFEEMMQGFDSLKNEALVSTLA